MASGSGRPAGRARRGDLPPAAATAAGGRGEDWDGRRVEIRVGGFGTGRNGEGEGGYLLAHPSRPPARPSAEDVAAATREPHGPAQAPAALVRRPASAGRAP
jgi:hypothetical protein